MNEVKQKHKNALVMYRRRMSLSQKEISRLLGHRDATVLSIYENGRRLPPLETALSLAIILRVPVEFLFPELFDELRSRIRQQEEVRYSRQTRPAPDNH